MRADLFVLNYNGAEFISDCVASLQDAVEQSRHECELWMIDNKSTDKSVEMIQEKFPKVRILPMSENKVLCSFNDAAARSTAEIVFLLNNDIKVDPSFIDPMISIFQKKEDAFLITAKSFLFDGSYEGGRSIPVVSFGSFSTTCRFPNFEKLKEEMGFTFAAGFGAFDRKKFLALGGYDDLYLPGRMEDADIGLRAWKKGWKSYYQPESILYHMGSKSFIAKFGRRGTMEIAHRNTFLFMWKNIRDPFLLAAHFFFLPMRLVWLLCRGQFEFLTALVKALGRLPKVIRKRRAERKISYPYSEREVISLFCREP